MSETCTNQGGGRPNSQTPRIVGHVRSSAGAVPRVDPTLRFPDRWGAWKARWGVGRMRYAVEPGLYAVGQPTGDSPVLVSANYKMSFDRLRSQLTGIDAWLLVLDTKGINVWCAAGKGTFGTAEIVRQVADTRLAEIVTHRRLIVPQLGAPGVAAHEVQQRCGFRVVYGPVRADDLPVFLEDGMRASAEMRRVRFPLWDRLAVAPIELVMSLKYVLVIAVLFFLLSGLGQDGYAWRRAVVAGGWSALLAGATCVGSTILFPAILPWLPGRMFAVKGFWLGAALVAVLGAWRGAHFVPLDGRVSTAAWCVLIPTMASFMAMNYTGSTTYTSLSGVRLEVRRAVPIQIACAALGAGLWLVGRFV